jgi:hypothetical protein
MPAKRGPVAAMRRGLSYLSSAFSEFLLSIFVFFPERKGTVRSSLGDDDDKPEGVRMNA